MKRVGLVAHDQKKAALVEWAKANRAALEKFELFATGTTRAGIVAATGLSIKLLKSGPLGGDAQLGAMIVEGELDALIFFQDPLTALTPLPKTSARSSGRLTVILFIQSSY